MSRVQHAPPFGMLLVGSCIRRYRGAVFSAHWKPAPPSGSRDRINYEHTKATVEITPNNSNSYLSHMGFWKSMGVELGKDPGEARGSDRYLPVSYLDLSDVKSDAAKWSKEIGDVLYDRADKLSEILSRQTDGAIQVTLAYAIRELFRNVFEHSTANRIWYSAQYWPSIDKVELGVLDEGCGVMTSLSRNPAVAVGTEVQAIRRATERGVSGVIPKPALVSLSGESSESRWTNAGWGLFVLKKLAECAGSLLVISNQAAMSFKSDSIRTFSVDHRGTGIRLILHPSRLDGLLRQILAESIESDPPSRLTPSMLERLSQSYW